MSLPVGMQTALERPSFLFVIATTITLPDRTLRLLDGEGVAVIDGQTYTGNDAVYGGIGSLETVTDGVDDQAPRVRITINVPDADGGIALSDPVNQGSPVDTSWAVMDQVTGLVIASQLIFSGKVDVPVFRPGTAQRQVEIDVASEWDQLLDSDDGARLNNAYQQSVWPGDLGCEFVTRLTVSVAWGAVATGAPTVNYSGGLGFMNNMINQVLR